MELVLVGALFVVNLLISWWNARAVGKAWVELKAAGGGRRFMAWMGALMSGAGFTWCYLLVIGVVLWKTGVLNEDYLRLFFEVGYVLIIPVVLFAGWAITIDSWRQAYHQRTLGNMSVAGWNTFATGYNTYNAVSGLGDVLGDIFKTLSKTRDGNVMMLLIALIAAGFALGLGAITTTLLIKHYAGQESLDSVAARAGHDVVDYVR
ncbi:MAG TPA: hypothetical protein VLF40_06260 [Candidatus Saccharimonadales bacterium]|nr:hypothetical protein [Candidatus Saccharimonadales bacterium]